jgi:hypothetical protein
MNKKLIILSKYLNSMHLKEESLKINLLVKEAASKVNALKKLGFSEKIAKEIDDACRGLSIWMANKLIEHIQKSELLFSKKNEIIEYINDNFRIYKSKVSYIMDWVRIGAMEDFNSYKENSFEDLYNLSDEWHKSLKSGDGEINYEEKNKIIIDLRDPDGTGYYWADLETNRSEEESDRMGHCGTTGYSNNLISLRRYIPIGKGFTLNKSILTASVDSNGKIVQLKGPKNSKPEPEYHKYIIELLNLKKINYEEDEDTHMITGFKQEYNSKNDFSLSDLSNDQILELEKTNPSLFNDIASRIRLSIILKDPSKAGDTSGEFVINKSLLKNIISIPSRSDLSSDHILDIIEDPGQIDWYYNYATIEDVKYSLSNIDNFNKNKIIELYKQEFPESKIDINNFEIEIKNNLKDFSYTDIASNIMSSINSATESAAYDKISNLLIDALNSFGEARIEDQNVYLKINIYDIIKSMNSSDQKIALHILEENDYDSKDETAEYFLEEIIGNGIIEPERLLINMDYINYDDDIFNEILKDFLI